MPISDHDFNEELDEVVESTIRLLQTNDQDEYPPVAFLAGDGDLDVMAIDDDADEGDDAAAATPAEADLPQLAREFGQSLAHDKKRAIDCVFFAHHATSDDGHESIVVDGATPDGRTNTAYLNLQRDANRNLRVTSSKAWHSPAPLAPPVNLATELLKGMGRA